MNSTYAHGPESRFGARDRFVHIAEPSTQQIRVCIYVLMLAVDCCCIALALLFANFLRFEDPYAAPGVTMLGALAPMYAIVAVMQHNYSGVLLSDWRESAKRALVSLGSAAAATLFIGFYLRAYTSISRDVSTTGMIISAALLFSSRFFLHVLLRLARAGHIYTEIVVVDGLVAVGDGAPLDSHWIEARTFGIAPDISSPVMLSRVGSMLKGADRVIVACDAQARGDWAAMLKASGIRGELLIPEISRYESKGVGAYGTASTLIVSAPPLRLSDLAQKRMLDVVVSALALAFLAPLFLAVAVAIKLQSRGPVFFRQPRMGRGNQMFEIWKFRTMRVEACDGAGTRSAQRDDDRVTAIGRFLRRSSIDELPQLFNVLAGEMSIVGPRPHALGSLAGDKLFWEVDGRYWQRHAAKPGMTGLAQVRGFRGPTEHESDLSQRLGADLDYLHNWSLWRDLLIMAATIKVLFHSNAF